MNKGWTPGDDAVYLLTLDRTVQPFATASVSEPATIVLLGSAVTTLVLSHRRIR